VSLLNRFSDRSGRARLAFLQASNGFTQAASGACCPVEPATATKIDRRDAGRLAHRWPPPTSAGRPVLPCHLDRPTENQESSRGQLQVVGLGSDRELGPPMIATLAASPIPGDGKPSALCDGRYGSIVLQLLNP
jgi:hypothetical protein